LYEKKYLTFLPEFHHIWIFMTDYHVGP